MMCSLNKGIADAQSNDVILVTQVRTPAVVNLRTSPARPSTVSEVEPVPSIHRTLFQ
jgi:hypothetical protein